MSTQAPDVVSRLVGAIKEKKALEHEKDFHLEVNKMFAGNFFLSDKSRDAVIAKGKDEGLTLVEEADTDKIPESLQVRGNATYFRLTIRDDTKKYWAVVMSGAPYVLVQEQ
eukprot:TRINITY_DN4661_c0_g1_i1.p1 TRINITY_DN4661_c0_g1~~TRINITY_DN4661_c0_g1_i1.p1  ORF type:complete len:111 (+),score=38.75 TRINITY_DN4661_c0_g1_i1:114-446(+)